MLQENCEEIQKRQEELGALIPKRRGNSRYLESNLKDWKITRTWPGCTPRWKKESSLAGMN